MRLLTLAATVAGLLAPRAALELAILGTALRAAFLAALLHPVDVGTVPRRAGRRTGARAVAALAAGSALHLYITGRPAVI